MSNKIDLEENGKYRVALDLMKIIADKEPSPAAGEDREYYLRLYRQCYDCVYGYRGIEDVVKAPSASGQDFGVSA